MVGGVSAMSPYVSTSYQYMGYARAKGVQPGRSVSAAAGMQGTRNAALEGQKGQEVGAVSGVQTGQRLSAVSGVQSGRGVGSVYGVRASLGVGAALAAGRSASPGTPVEPVRPVSTVEADAPRGIGYMIPFLREGMDPAELAVRMRIQYVDSAELAAGKDSKQGDSSVGLGIDGVREAAQEGECQTCKQRKYQDGSDDAGVSYKAPTRIAPDQAAAAVRGHEMEHVVRERAAAEREDRRVVSQSVTMHTAICPECGTVYVSGGTTRTTTAADTQPEQPEQQTDNGGSVAT